jgi:hypothetical protein
MLTESKTLNFNNKILSLTLVTKATENTFNLITLFESFIKFYEKILRAKYGNKVLYPANFSCY